MTRSLLKCNYKKEWKDEKNKLNEKAGKANWVTKL